MLGSDWSLPERWRQVRGDGEGEAGGGGAPGAAQADGVEQAAVGHWLHHSCEPIGSEYSMFQPIGCQ